jgi:uncharacterized membrane protein
MASKCAVDGRSLTGDPVLAFAQMSDRTAAQARADQIHAFRREVERLKAEGVETLSEEQRARITAHQDRLLAELAARFDVDVSSTQRQMSIGLRIASFLGAAALSASAVLFFRRIWGSLPTSGQVVILVLAPLVFLVAAHLTSRRERTPYLTSLLALLSLACFVLDLSMLGAIFNLPASSGAFLAWGVFGVAVGLGYRLRLPLAAGLVSLGIWSAAILQILLGHAWWTCFERPESLLPAALGVLALPSLRPATLPGGLAPASRLVGMVGLFGVMLVLSESGDASYLPPAAETVEALYLLVGVILAGALTVWGLRRRWPEVTWSAAAFFALFLFLKFVDWWWDWMPHYLFFLLVGLVVLGLLLLVRRLRDRFGTEAAP